MAVILSQWFRKQNIIYSIQNNFVESYKQVNKLEKLI